MAPALHHHQTRNGLRIVVMNDYNDNRTSDDHDKIKEEEEEEVCSFVAHGIVQNTCLVRSVKS